MQIHQQLQTTLRLLYSKYDDKNYVEQIIHIPNFWTVRIKTPLLRIHANDIHNIEHLVNWVNNYFNNSNVKDQLKNEQKLQHQQLHTIENAIFYLIRLFTHHNTLTETLYNMNDCKFNKVSTEYNVLLQTTETLEIQFNEDILNIFIIDLSNIEEVA